MTNNNSSFYTNISEASDEYVRLNDEDYGSIRPTPDLIDGQDTPDNNNNSSNNGAFLDMTHGGKSSLSRVCFNFVTAIVGSGIVALSLAVYQGGVVLSVGLLVLVAILADYSIRLLVRVGIRSGVRNYEEVMDVMFGLPGYTAICVSLLLFDYGALLSYLIILCDLSQDLVHAFMLSHDYPFEESDKIVVRRWSLLILSNVFILPLVLFRDISKLEQSSIIAVFSVVIIIVVVFYASVTGDNCFDGADCPDMSKPWLTVIGDNPAAAFGIITFSFVSHDSAFLLFATLKDATSERWKRTTRISLMAAMTICLFIALPGYLLFREKTQGNILKNFSVMDTKIVFVRAIYTVTMILTYPISFFICRHILNELGHRFHVDSESRIPGTPSGPAVQQISLTRHLLLTLPLFYSTILIVAFVSDVGDVMSITGNVSATAIAFIFPPLCAIKHIYNHEPVLQDLGWRIAIPCASGTSEDGAYVDSHHLWLLRKKLLSPLLLLIFGIGTMLFCTGFSVYQILQR